MNFSQYRWKTVPKIGLILLVNENNQKKLFYSFEYYFGFLISLYL